MHQFSVFLRSCLFNACLAILTLFFAFLALFSWIFPDTWAYRLVTTWSRFVLFLAKHVCGIRYEVEGLENLPKTNAIVLCKHQSTWETLFMQTLLPRQTWVLKRELLYIPFFGWGLARLKPIAIRRNQAHSVQDLLKQGKQALNRGQWVIIFPEGTRVLPHEQKKYARSGAALALETGYPLLPIAHNAGHCWPKNSFLRYPGLVSVKIGEPLFPLPGISSQALNKTLATWIESESKLLWARARQDEPHSKT